MLKQTALCKNSSVFSKFISSKAILHIHPFSVLDAESDCCKEEFSHQDKHISHYKIVVGLFKPGNEKKALLLSASKEILCFAYFSRVSMFQSEVSKIG